MIYWEAVTVANDTIFGYRIRHRLNSTSPFHVNATTDAASTSSHGNKSSYENNSSLFVCENRTSAWLTDLQVYTYYWVEVIAFTNETFGNESIIKVFRTDEGGKWKWYPSMRYMITFKYHLRTDFDDLRTFALIVSAHPYCARKFTFHVMHRVRAKHRVLKWTMIGQMAIAIALLKFNDLGRWMTPLFFSETDFIPHCLKRNKKSMWEGKKLHNFCPRDIESCHHAAARRVKL